MSLNPSIQYVALPGYDGYLAGGDGTIWSCRQGEWRQLKPYIYTNKSGQQYLGVGIRGNDGKQHTKMVHGLILLAFVGPKPPGLQCRHLDGDNFNNAATNLCWGTQSENEADKTRLGTRANGVKHPFSGPKHPCSKLTEQDVLNIRADYATGQWGYKRLRARYGVSRQTISAVVNRLTWKHL